MGCEEREMIARRRESADNEKRGVDAEEQHGGNKHSVVSRVGCSAIDFLCHPRWIFCVTSDG